MIAFSPKRPVFLFYLWVVVFLLIQSPVPAENKQSGQNKTATFAVEEEQVESTSAENPGRQAPDGLPGKRVAVKLNGLLLAGVVNPAVEFAVHNNISVQLEGMGVFYHDHVPFLNFPLVLGLSFIEGRFYPKEVYRGFYAGPNLGWGVWKMNKSIAPGYFGSYNNNSVQYGHNVMLGLNLGYQWVLSKRWSLDLNLGLGWQHSTYEGYKNGVLYTDPSIPEGRPNRSAEWMPAYKGGLFFSYRF
ncbi:MAG TPA: DUF3575 domain-containing protein [Bacteroidales bacterium]|nr:DUF3575 domain-containing protein [Bacteroidales bacterium]HOQ57466.1 DUF3575 domain-containing protein [Bacteroidales bacterium]